MDSAGHEGKQLVQTDSFRIERGIANERCPVLFSLLPCHFRAICKITHLKLRLPAFRRTAQISRIQRTLIT